MGAQSNKQAVAKLSPLAKQQNVNLVYPIVLKIITDNLKVEENLIYTILLLSYLQVRMDQHFQFEMTVVWEKEFEQCLR